MQRVIGLDIGSYSIKAVEIVNTFKSYEITNFYENVIPNVAEFDQDIVIPACMEQLFVENRLEADRIITAMPGQYISSRVMSFNFADPRKIEMAVLAEVEDAVPFNMDDMIVDHQILGTMNGKTVALVVMTRKNFMRSFLEHLQRINIDPKLVDVDSLAFYNLSSYLTMEPGQCCALVDVGHEKTSVCIVQDGVLRMFRSINLGGRYLTEFLARDLETEFSEAQRVKHQVSRVFSEGSGYGDLTGDDQIVAERLTLASNAIVKELGRTFYAFKTWEKSPLQKIFLSGGSTRISHFDTYLQEQLEIPVILNRLDQSELKTSAELSDHMAVMPQSIAIGMRAVSSMKRHSQINLRQGEFAYIQNYESVLRGSAIAFRIVGVALLLLGISYAVMQYFYDKQIEALQVQYLKEYSEVVPEARRQYRGSDVSFSKLRSDAVARLQADVSQKQQAVQLFIEDNAASPALISLREISAALPSELKVDITLFQFNTTQTGEGKLVLRGETDGYASVSSVIENLKRVEIFENLEEKASGAKPGTDNKVIEFTINADYAGSLLPRSKA